MLEDFYEFKYKNTKGKWNKIQVFFEDMIKEFLKIRESLETEEQIEKSKVF